VNPPSPRDASSSGDNEKLEEEEDQDQLRRTESAAEKAEEDAERRNDLNRLRSTATATSVASTTPAARLPEQKPWYKQPNPLRWGKIPPVSEEKEVCPEHKAGFFSVLFFGWIAPLMDRGYKRQLEVNDIYSINPDRAVDPLTEKMRAAFKRRVEAGDKYPLAWAMHEAFFWEFWLGGFCALMSSILQVMSPFVLRFLIQFATDAYIASTQGLPAPPIGNGVGLVVGVTAMQVLQSLATNHFIYRGMLVGGMSRASLISLIYEKSMVISARARAGGAEVPDIPAARAAEQQRLKDEAKKAKNKPKKGPAGNQPPVSGDGVGWDNGRFVSCKSTPLPLPLTIVTDTHPDGPDERRHLQNRPSIWHVPHHLDRTALMPHHPGDARRQPVLQRPRRLRPVGGCHPAALQGRSELVRPPKAHQ
jgi:hypothetical protein